MIDNITTTTRTTPVSNVKGNDREYNKNTNHSSVKPLNCNDRKYNNHNMYHSSVKPYTEMLDNITTTT